MLLAAPDELFSVTMIGLMSWCVCRAVLVCWAHVLVCVLCSACLLLLGRVVLVAVCAVPITVPLTHSQVSYTASGTQFENRERFPRLYTLQPLVFSYNDAYVHIIRYFKWSRVAVIYEVDALFSAVRPVGGAGWVG